MPMSATLSEMVYSQSKNTNNEASVSYLDVNSFLACISKGNLLLSAHSRGSISLTIDVEYPVEGGIPFLIGDTDNEILNAERHNNLTISPFPQRQIQGG
jgi:hypothetical protein